MNQSYCFQNGKIITEKDARISVNDLGLHRAYGVFDVLRTYHGKPFLLDEHLDRFFASAKEFDLKIPYTKKIITEIIYKLLSKNNFDESQIKLMITGGESSDGINYDGQPTFLIFVKKLTEPNGELYKIGIKLLTYEHQRYMPLVKSLNYIDLMKSQNKLKKNKAYTLLYISDKQVLEGATCNIFMIKNQIISTPKSHILNGITRDFVINLAKKEFKIDKKKIILKVLLSADEIFVTLTTKGILPVVKIDDKKIGNGKPGKITKQLIDLFNSTINNPTISPR